MLRWCSSTHPEPEQLESLKFIQISEIGFWKHIYESKSISSYLWSFILSEKTWINTFAMFFTSTYFCDFDHSFLSNFSVCDRNELWKLQLAIAMSLV